MGDVSCVQSCRMGESGGAAAVDVLVGVLLGVVELRGAAGPALPPNDRERGWALERVESGGTGGGGSRWLSNTASSLNCSLSSSVMPNPSSKPDDIWTNGVQEEESSGPLIGVRLKNVTIDRTLYTKQPRFRIGADPDSLNSLNQNSRSRSAPHSLNRRSDHRSPAYQRSSPMEFAAVGKVCSVKHCAVKGLFPRALTSCTPCSLVCSCFLGVSRLAPVRVRSLSRHLLPHSPLTLCSRVPGLGQTAS